MLITGGAGFIGSHLTDLLLARGDMVTVVDNLSTGRRENLPKAHERLRFLEADVKDALAAFGRGEIFDEVYHLAAAVGVKLVLDDPIRAIETNIEQTSALLHFVIRQRSKTPPASADASEGTHGSNKTRVLIASSSEVYGKSTHSPFSEEDDVVYGPTTVSRWSYACSKAVDEYLALAFHRQHRLAVVVARFFNTVGPRQVGEYGMVLPRFVRSALQGTPIQVYGDGTQSRCFCDVRDVVQALPKLIADKECSGRVFNVGSDRAITIADLANLVVARVGSASKIELVPYTAAYAKGFEDLQQRKPDLARIRKTIGFAPSIPLERTIDDLAAEIRQGAMGISGG